MDLLAAHAHIIVADFHSMGALPVSGDLDAAVGDGGAGLAFTVVDGEAVVVQSAVASGNAGEPRQFLGQLDIQAIPIGILHHPDVAVRELRGISPTGQFHGFTQTSGDCLSVVPGKFPFAQAVHSPFGCIAGQFLHIADIGSVGIVTVVPIDDAALHIGDVLAARIDAIFVDGHPAGFERAVRTQVHILVQFDVEGTAVCRGGDVAVPFDGNSTAQVCLGGIPIISGKPEAAAPRYLGHFPSSRFQLVFRSGPAGYVVGPVPGQIGQAGDIVGPSRAAADLQPTVQGDGIKVGQIFSQFDGQSIVRSHYTEILPVRQAALICHAPGNLQGLVQQPGGFPAVSRKSQPIIQGSCLMGRIALVRIRQTGLVLLCQILGAGMDGQAGRRSLRSPRQVQIACTIGLAESCRLIAVIGHGNPGIPGDFHFIGSFGPFKGHTAVHAFHLGSIFQRPGMGSHR